MKRGLLLGLIVVIACLPAPASAGEGKPFRWNDAQACAVYSATDVRCFASEAEMEAATATSTEAVTASALLATYCAGRSDLWLYVYEFSNYGGRVLKFRDGDIWQNFSVWGFDNQTTSYRNTTLCPVYLAENANGGGAWLVAGASSSSAYVGASWDNRASSLYIDA